MLVFRALFLYRWGSVNQVTILLDRSRYKNLGEKKISREHSNAGTDSPSNTRSVKQKSIHIYCMQPDQNI